MPKYFSVWILTSYFTFYKCDVASFCVLLLHIFGFFWNVILYVLYTVQCTRMYEQLTLFFVAPRAFSLHLSVILNWTSVMWNGWMNSWWYVVALPHFICFHVHFHVFSFVVLFAFPLCHYFGCLSWYVYLSISLARRSVLCRVCFEFLWCTACPHTLAWHFLNKMRFLLLLLA